MLIRLLSTAELHLFALVCVLLHHDWTLYLSQLLQVAAVSHRDSVLNIRALSSRFAAFLV